MQEKSEIGRKNNIKVEEEDTRSAMMKEIQKYPGQEKQVMDYFKNNPEAQQQLSGPIFEKITIQLDQEYYAGKKFVIEAKNENQETNTNFYQKDYIFKNNLSIF